MSQPQMTNLDIRCAELGRKLSQIRDKNNKLIEEKMINDALAVLEEQGPYAMFLFLKGRHSKVAGDINKHAQLFLMDIFGNKVSKDCNILDTIKSLANEELDDLLFARDLIRTALAYARYHIKARSEGSA